MSSPEKLLQQIDTIFESPNEFNPQKMQDLIGEMLGFFDSIKAQLISPNEEERKKGLEQAVALKEKLEEQAFALCKSIGMEPEILENYMNNPNHFSPEEWHVIEKAKEDLKEYKKTLHEPEEKRKKQQKKKKTQKKWLVG